MDRMFLASPESGEQIDTIAKFKPPRVDKWIEKKGRLRECAFLPSNLPEMTDHILLAVTRQ
jgi:hypothetical protein